MSDIELAIYLGIADDIRWPQVIAKIDVAKRQLYERMFFVEQELNAGRVPSGVIVCE